MASPRLVPRALRVESLVNAVVVLVVGAEVVVLGLALRRLRLMLAADSFPAVDTLPAEALDGIVDAGRERALAPPLIVMSCGGLLGGSAHSAGASVSMSSA